MSSGGFVGGCALWYLVGGSVSLGVVQGLSGAVSSFSTSSFVCCFVVRVGCSCMDCAVFIDGLRNGYELRQACDAFLCSD